jgi:hypothetical protein
MKDKEQISADQPNVEEMMTAMGSGTDVSPLSHEPKFPKGVSNPEANRPATYSEDDIWVATGIGY